MLNKEWPLIQIGGETYRLKFSIASSYKLSTLGFPPGVMGQMMTQLLGENRQLELDVKLASAGLQRKLPLRMVDGSTKYQMEGYSISWETTDFSPQFLADLIGEEEDPNAKLTELSAAVWAAIKNLLPATSPSQTTPANGATGPTVEQPIGGASGPSEPVPTV